VKRRILLQSDGPYSTFSQPIERGAPVPTTNYPTHPRKILLGTDLSSRCDRAFDRAAELSAQWRATLVIAHALQRDVSSPNTARREVPSWRRTAHEAVLIARQQVRQDLMGRDVSFEVYIEESEPVDLILKLVRETQCDLIVTGTARSETFGRILLGTTVEQLARQSPVPILVVKTRPRRAYSRVLVATDFSDASRSALSRAAELFPDAAITLLHCYRPILHGLAGDSQCDGGNQLAQAECDEFLSSLPSDLRHRLEILIEGGSLESVVGAFFADKGLDLLVMGSKGRSAMAHVLLGSTADRLLSSARSDVLIVPGGPNPASS